MSTVAELTARPLDQRTASLNVIKAIETATNQQLPRDITLMDAYANRLRRCADPVNTWIAEDLHNEDTGELFNGSGRLWACSCKLCPYCLSKQSKRNRKKLQIAIDRQRLFVGEDFYFLTLTQPNPNLPLLEVRSLMNEAWKLFRKRRYIRRQIAGYCKAEEFTVTKTGIHYHYHLHVRSKYLRYQYIRQQWTESLIQAYTNAGRSFFANTQDGLALVKINKITDHKKAINEVAKYITKADSWEKIPTTDLLEIIRIERFPRMFELGGTYKPEIEEKTILDTESISDAEAEQPPILWREYIRSKGLQAYQSKLAEDIDQARTHRLRHLTAKYPYATFKTLADLEPLCRIRPAQGTSTPENRSDEKAKNENKFSFCKFFEEFTKQKNLFDDEITSTIT